LNKNHFEAHSVNDLKEAERPNLGTSYSEFKCQDCKMGRLADLGQSHILERLQSDPELEYFPKFEAGGSWETIWERCRQALHVDLYMSGTNALTETGILVNLDTWGNRAGALVFGPKNVIILAGRNKIVPDLEDVIDRVKRIAASMNAIRHSRKAGEIRLVQKKGSAQIVRILCEYAMFGRYLKSLFPKRIKVVLINEDLGY